MWHGYEEWLIREREHQRREEARRAAQIRLALAEHDPAPALYAPLLVWVGRRMSGWGQAMERRYSAPAAPCYDCRG